MGGLLLKKTPPERGLEEAAAADPFDQHQTSSRHVQRDFCAHSLV
jgi:hypothetical protein